MQAAFRKWLWERTGVNVLEQRRLPASLLRRYLVLFRAGQEAASANEHGIDGVIARGW